jgi:hypothetical protein
MIWFTAFLGLALMLAPFIMGYTYNALALWTSLIMGLIVLVVSIYKGVKHDKAQWEYMVIAIVGLLAVFAPFILGFNATTIAVWTMVVLGGILAILAGFEGFFAKPQTK